VKDKELNRTIVGKQFDFATLAQEDDNKGNCDEEIIFTEKELKALEAEEQLKRNLFDKSDGLKQIP
jgi:hypothetical protein